MICALSESWTHCKKVDFKIKQTLKKLERKEIKRNSTQSSPRCNFHFKNEQDTLKILEQRDKKKGA